MDQLITLMMIIYSKKETEIRGNKMYELKGTKDGITVSWGIFETELDASTEQGSIMMDYEYEDVDFRIVPLIQV